jgi:DNA-directed RNA polymerase II subunit RPB1
MGSRIKIPETTISSIKFLPYSNYDVLSDTRGYTLKNVDLHKGDEPVENGLYDLHMGTTSKNYICKTCGDTSTTCTGHFAQFALHYPLLSMINIKNSRLWLNIYCFHCHQLMVTDPHKYRKQPKKKRLKSASSYCVNSKRHQCPHCGVIHPIIVPERDSGSKANITIRYEFSDGSTRSLRLPPHVIEDIFATVHPDILDSLGIDQVHHPNTFVFNKGFLVSPNNMRPSNILNVSPNENTGNPEFTRILMTIGKKLIDTIPKSEDAIKRLRSLPFANLFAATTYTDVAHELERIKGAIDNITEIKDLLNNIEAVHELIYNYQFGSKSGSSNMTQITIRNARGSVMSIGSKMISKKGIIRQFLMGGRCYNVFRNVIIGSSMTRFDFIKIPLYIARICKEAMTVQPYNIHEAQIYFNNEKEHKYPGCTYIYKKKKDGTYVTYNLREHACPGLVLEYGDIIFRDIIFGDMPYWNRQPSLSDSAITTVKVEINNNPLNQAVAMNGPTCNLYGADFDGDNMQGGFMQAQIAKAEAKYLISTAAHIISPQHSKTTMGLIEDSIAGIAVLSMFSSKYHKYHAMPLLRNTSTLATFDDPRVYTGREIVSKLIPAGINYKINSSSLKGDYRNFIEHDPSDLTVLIEKGELKSGIMDKAALGAGQFNGFFQTINREYGPHVTLDTMFNFHQLGIAGIDSYGLTYSPYDYSISSISRQLIERASAADITKAWEQLDKLIQGKIAPPLNMTMSSYIEELMIQNWRQGYTKEILAGLPNDSAISLMIRSGSKGKIENLEQMASPRGQVLINKSRPPKLFGYKRTLPYTTRYSVDPVDNGLVINSLTDGMTTKEYFFSCQSDRYNLIVKALMTAVTGANSRKSMRSTESQVISYIYRLALQNNIIYQFTYGMNNYDCRRIEYVNIDYIGMSNADFDNKFKRYNEAPFTDEYLRLRADRDYFRKIWLAQESAASQPIFNEKEAHIQVPIHIRHLILNLRSDKSATKEELAEMVVMVRKYCEEEIYYTMFNARMREMVRAGREVIPDFVKRAYITTCIHIRENLNSNMYLGMLTKDTLKKVLDMYSVYIKNALVPPGTASGIIATQSISEPQTQNNLSATHGTKTGVGGAAKTGMRRVDTVMSAKEDAEAQMLINVLPEYANDPIKIEEIISHIEMLSFMSLTHTRQIFYDKIGETIHPGYINDNKMVKRFIELNPLIQPPSNVSGWNFRFEIDRDVIILKKISMREIITKLTAQMPELYCVYTPENAETVIVRIYTTSSKLSDRTPNSEIERYFRAILNIPIRGIKGIKSAGSITKKFTMLDPATGEFKMKDRKCIYTIGSNIPRIIGVKGIDLTSIQSDSVPDMYRMYGIEAARMKLINEYRSLVPEVNYTHIAVYADEMCNTAGLSGFTKAGLGHREGNNILLKMSNQTPVAALVDAAQNGTESKIYGASAPLFLGRVPEYGSNFSKVIRPINGTGLKPVSTKPRASILDEF